MEHFADDDLEDAEYPDFDEIDDEETIPCPYCREPLYEDAERCPSCGQYISSVDAPRRQPWWVVLGVVLGLIVALWWIIDFF